MKTLFTFKYIFKLFFRDEHIVNAGHDVKMQQYF